MTFIFLTPSLPLPRAMVAMVQTAVHKECCLRNNMDSKASSLEVYFQKMQRHFEQNSKIRDVQAHTSKVSFAFILCKFICTSLKQ